jgi:hypothetical protein
MLVFQALGEYIGRRDDWFALNAPARGGSAIFCCEEMLA